jgi:catecholate siderophore receptor
MNSICRTTFTALLLASAAPAFAEEAADGAAVDSAATAEADDQTIVVTGQRAEYGVRSTSTATRTNTIIRNIPQALTVISESQIEDQALRSIAELLTFVPGATPGTGEGNRDQITLRGNNTTADFFVDGLRDDVQYFRDLYNVDRVEVLRGSNAMIFGRGGGGGVVNRVTKRSSLSPFREFTVSSGSEGGARLSADLDQPLGSGVGVRVNGVYEDGDSFRRDVDLERYAINPTVGFVAGPNTRFDLSYEYLRDRRTADRGVPADGNRPLVGFDGSFFGDPGRSSSKANVHLAALAVEHGLGEGLTLRNRTLYGNYDKFYENIYPSDLIESTRQVRLSAYNDSTRRKNLLSQTDLVWENRLGGIDQTLLFGFELGRQSGHNQRRNGVFSTTGTGSILVPVDSASVDVPVAFTGGGANNGMKASIAAVYAQDQLRPSDWLEIVAGLRFDRFSLDIDNRNNGGRFSRTDDLVSPRLGLILKPRANLSLYTSYSRSYLPQSGDQFNSLDVTSEALKPEKFDNYEFGGKWEPLEGLLATAAVYQLDRANTRAPGSTPGTVVLTGAQRSRGLELGLERSISDRWQVSAGYALQKAEITETTSAAPEGREVPLVPRHQFSLWNRYDVSDALGVGLGVIGRSKSYASVSNAVKLPGYTRVDAALFYDLGRGIEAQLNLENLFDVDYFPTAHNDNNIAPGAPRTLRATVRAGF